MKKTVFITGANRGLGLEFVKQYLAKGYLVIGTTRSLEGAEELVATGAEVLELDVTDQKSIIEAVKPLKGRVIDILINNAGYIGPTESHVENFAQIDSLSTEEMMDCFKINTIGPVYVIQALMPYLRLKEEPKIVNISSKLGQLCNDYQNIPWGYSISKAGVNMVTKNLHTQMHEEGLIVVSVSPGHCNTEMGKGELEPEVSIGNMIPLIEKLTPSDSGRFWNHDGEELSW
ncbi:SDR family oxidoreductase [Akkermansiaceae bacterium]|nr:SDR family oxidoreductase [Akkermansiaceae bacterium]